MGLFSSFTFVFTSLISTADSIPFKLDSIEVKVFNTKVMIKSHPEAKFLFFAPHNDENDGPKAIKMLHDSIKYNYIYFKNPKSARNLYGNMNGVSFVVDPNRIFTKVGMEAQINRTKELKNHKPFTNAVKNFSQLTIKLLQEYAVPNNYIIALHNNKDYDLANNPNDLTILKEKRDGEFIAICINDTLESKIPDIDNYLYLSSRVDFDSLCNKQLNAGLMPAVSKNKKKPKNDGSLSYYTSMKGMPYINIEIQHGATKTNFRYLMAVIELLNKKNEQISLNLNSK